MLHNKVKAQKLVEVTVEDVGNGKYSFKAGMNAYFSKKLFAGVKFSLFARWAFTALVSILVAANLPMIEAFLERMHTVILLLQ
jgi:hypothetical protein